MKLNLLIVSILLPIFAQAQVGMAQWRTHFSYNEMSQVEETPTKVFAISDGALFSVNKEDNTLDTYSKINGLNDNTISFIRYNPTVNALVIAYQNGNIDLLYSNDKVSNIADIKNKTISASKIPNDITFVDEYAYISCGIGIIAINLSKREIKDSYIIGTNSSNVEIKSVAFLGDSIYALVADGMYVANKNNNLLVDYNNWKYRTNTELSTTENKKIVAFNDNLYLLKSSGAVYSSADAINWSIFNHNSSITGIRVSGEKLNIFTSSSIFSYNTSLSSENLTGLKITDLVYNKAENNFWIASADSTGILKIQNGTLVQNYKPEGPATNKIINVKYDNERIFALTGAPWDNNIYDENRAGAIMIFEDNEWINITNNEVKPLSNRDFEGVTYIAADKNDKQHFYVSTYRNGLFEFKNDIFFNRYNNSNSNLETYAGSSNDDYINLDGVCFDNNNNLWMNNAGSGNNIKVLLSDGTWAAQDYFNGTMGAFDKIIVTENNFKWLNIPNTKEAGGIFIIDDKNNPSTQNLHEYKLYSYINDQDGNTLDLTDSYSLVEDLNGEVWVGTLEGPLIFKNIDDIFDADYTAYRVKVPRDDGSDYADYLLEGESVKALAVDGANRKWIGTGNSGIYLMSEDGLETIQHFTVDNSPILSNTILSIAIDKESGEVFFATESGLISYVSDATTPKESYQTISIYPNPVRENFTGLLTINGLIENTIVKITDANGRLVYQTESIGGTATWNCYNSKGGKASTGVYYVMVSNGSENNTENVETAVGKILIIK